MRLRLGLAAIALVAGCGPSPAPKPAGSPWVAEWDRTHPLVGMIWATKSRRFVPLSDLEKDVHSASYLLLGERHDSADHHRLQAQLARGFVHATKSTLVFEMISVRENAALLACDKTLTGYERASRWSATGFPPFALYEPLFQVAVEERTTVVGAGIDRAMLATWSGKVVPLHGPDESALHAELRASHCGMLPESAVPKMARAQYIRDEALAQALLAAPRAVLIAGAGHARLDRGVGSRLGAASRKAVAFVEVGAERDPALLARSLGENAYDYLWFTPRGSNDDPCAGFPAPGPSPTK